MIGNHIISLYKLTKNANKFTGTEIYSWLSGTEEWKGGLDYKRDENIIRGMDMIIILSDSFSCHMSKIIELYI